MARDDDLQRAREVYLRATRLDPGSERELLARVTAGEPPAEPVRVRRWVAAVGLAAVAAVAVVAVVGWLQGGPPSEPLALPLDDVSLSLAGEGRVGGTRRAPVIDWQSGKVSVSVTPHRGVDLTVATPEAVVRVVGTVFSVERELEATEVVVERGTVNVTCVGLPEVAVRGGERLTCQPAGLEGRVQRALALAAAGGSPGQRLEAIDAALALTGDAPALAAELSAHRVRALSDAGRADDALAEAHRALELPDAARRAELAAFVARSEFVRGGCASVGAVERAVSLDPTAPEGLLLASCLAEADPDAARALLEAARRLHLDASVPPFEVHMVTTARVDPEPGVIVHDDMKPNSPQLRALYHSSHVFCLPTLGDCLPMVLCEAGVVGLAVISTDVGAIREIVVNERTGV
ncbi:MAG: glycosyltransferase, partial [Myxococcota bacterium]